MWQPNEYHLFSQGYLWITPSHLYKVFTDYLSSVGSRLKPQQKKFISTLENIGLTVTRRRCKELFKGQFRCIELSPRIIKEALKPLYGDVEIHQDGLVRRLENFESNVTHFKISGLLSQKNDS